MGISLDTARKLKDAGLKWEPETCDTYYWPRKFNNPVLSLLDVQLSVHIRQRFPCAGIVVFHVKD